MQTLEPAACRKPCVGCTPCVAVTLLWLQVPPEEAFSVTYIRERALATASLIFNAVLSRIALEVSRSETDDMDSLNDFGKCAAPPPPRARHAHTTVPAARRKRALYPASARCMVSFDTMHLGTSPETGRATLR